MKKHLFSPLAFLPLALALAACGGDGDDAPSVADGITETVRQLLAETSPDTAPGQVLELTRVIIPVGEGIPPHTHPGPQLAIVIAGTVTYTVIEGEATVTRAVTSDEERRETYSSGATIEIGPGDALVEPAGMLHQAANQSDEPVVIYLSSLFEAGRPPAITAQ